MNRLEQEERFSRGCAALTGLKELLAYSAPGTCVSAESLACIVELIDNDLKAGMATTRSRSAIND